MTMDGNKKTKETIQHLSSQQNYKFVLNFKDDDLIAEIIP